MPLDLDCNGKPIYEGDYVIVVSVLNPDPDAQKCLGKFCRIQGWLSIGGTVQLETDIPSPLGGFFLGYGYLFQKIGGNDTVDTSKTDKSLEEV